MCDVSGNELMSYEGETNDVYVTKDLGPDLESLPYGVYFIKVVTEDEILHIKVVKEE